MVQQPSLVRGLSGIDVGFAPRLPQRDFEPARAIIRRHVSDESSPEASSMDASADVDVWRPLQPGVLIGRMQQARHGTVGLFVRDASGAVAGLTCAHVLRDATGRRPGTVSHPPSGDGCTRIGQVHALMDGWYGDAGLFRLDTDIAPTPATAAQLGTDDIVATTGFARLGDLVRKSGAGTGVTSGVVDGIGYYRLDERGGFMMGFRIRARDGDREEISGGSDSGAVWYRVADTAGVGLHTGFDRVSGRRYAIASHLPCVLTVFGVVPLAR